MMESDVVRQPEQTAEEHTVQWFATEDGRIHVYRPDDSDAWMVAQEGVSLGAWR